MITALANEPIGRLYFNMYTDNELYFPYEVIPSLQNLRGSQWQALVKKVLSHDENHESVQAFTLMMVRLNGCLNCETDSYRAMRGCAACTFQTLRRYKGTDEDLLNLYEIALKDVRQFAQDHQMFGHIIKTETD